MTCNNALLIFMKAPLQGNVKTRLQPRVSPEIALALYRAMGLDLLFNIMANDKKFDIHVFYWPENNLPAILEWLGADFNYYPQKGNNLGERMHNALLQILSSESYEKAIIIGSDLPLLNHPLITYAFHLLETHDLVLGPTFDGGYYLIGLKNPQPKLFDGVDWSTDSVLAQTLDHAHRLRLSTYKLDVQRDIDTFADLRYYFEEFQKTELVGKTISAPRTFHIIKEIFSPAGEKNKPENRK